VRTARFQPAFAGLILAQTAGHTLWSLLEGGYTPGVATAPMLLLGAGYLGSHLKQENRLPA
jgi:hypothetical protein